MPPEPPYKPRSILDVARETKAKRAALAPAPPPVCKPAPAKLRDTIEQRLAAARAKELHLEAWRAQAERNLSCLPTGSNFAVAYHAADQQWHGALRVPGQAPITGSSGGVVRLLAQLERQWRATLGQPGQTPIAASDEAAGGGPLPPGASASA